MGTEKRDSTRDEEARRKAEANSLAVVVVGGRMSRACCSSGRTGVVVVGRYRRAMWDSCWRRRRAFIGELLGSLQKALECDASAKCITVSATVSL